MSKLACFFSCLAIFFVSFIFYPRWEKPTVNATISWDVSGYYWYLPATFIYKDLKQQAFADSILQKYVPTPERQQSFKHSSGNWVNVYSSGMSIMYLPFFTIAHFISRPLGYPADGFSLPYQLAVQMSSVLIAFIGIWYYRKLLLRFFNDGVVSIMILLLVIGTNYLNYTAIDGALTHNWLFTLYTMLLLNTDNYYTKPQKRYAINIGLLIGIIVLIRPTEIIAILIPALWGIENIKIASLRRRLHFLLLNKKHVIVTALLVILIGSIQVFYWYYVTGNFLVYSYEEKGFSWLHPHFIDYTLSYKSGWLTYTPLLVFSFLGIITFLRKGKNKVLVLTFFILSWYITSAWDIWWYGGTGGRAMIQAYPIILFPFAYFIDSIRKNNNAKWLFTPIILLFCYVNIWFTYSAHAEGGLYDPNGMTKAYYWHVVGRYNVPEHTKIFKDTDEYFTGVPHNLTLLYSNDFEDSSIASSNHVIEGQYSGYIDKDVEFGPEFTIPFNKKNADWVRASINAKVSSKEWDYWRMPQFIISFIRSSEKNYVKSNMIRINRFIEPGTLQNLFFDVKVPQEQIDSIKVWLWNPGSYHPIIVDNLKLYTFEEQ